ncbi:MAG TPA: hypothetical protein VKD28_19125 [Gemmatimonadales bacterium]|nr:hypothetical protein [Gemmatimonadales bacterium]
MRLATVAQPHSLGQRIQFRVIRWLLGHVPGPILTMSYHRELFGKHFAQCLQEAMRGQSSASVGERELFSAFVSKLNQCPY